MRNLKLLTCAHVSGHAELRGSQAVRVDCDTGHVYCVTGSQVSILEPSSSQIVESVSLVDDDYLPCDGSGWVVGAEHLPDQQSLCLATSKGDVILWNVPLKQLECVGSVASGLTAMQWSPDQEIVVFTTGQDTVLLMTREFEPITEVPLQQAEFGEAAFITVGWGKKETQFHGSIGKSAAHVKDQKVKPVLPWDDRTPRISWRGDGQYFVISAINPTTGSRQLRVWNRDGTLHSTSENVDSLEQALAWKPSGSLIVSTQRCPAKHDVIFYEKNGLRHGEFTLPFRTDEVEVKEVLWNLDSTILIVWCEDLPPKDRAPDFIPKSYIQLWTVNNYHWYLKQSLHFKPTNEDRVVSILWDPEHAYRLHLLTAGGDYLQYTWSWVTNHSSGSTVDDQSTVAVIDGDRILMTPMRGMVVPPPMASYQLQLPCPVNQVVFAPPPYTNDIAVVLVDGRVAVYQWKEGEKSSTEGVKTLSAGGNGFAVCCDLPKLQHMCRLEMESGVSLDYPLSRHHFTWVSPDTFMFCSLHEGQPHSVIHQAEITAGDSPKLVIRSAVDVQDVVMVTCPIPVGGEVALQLTDGTVLRADTVSGTVQAWEMSNGQELQFPQPCSQMAVTEIGREEVVLGLTERFRFYVNNLEVASNCTSFAVHDQFLLLSTHMHTCRCICRTTNVNALPALSDRKSHPFDESVRRVERGSRIVTVVTEDTKLILQMPRGNLETIHPRALVLSAVRTALDRLEFHIAFTIMRKHRINMNLIYDHDPQTFLKNVNKFIRQINTVNHINLFLTDLQEEDVTVTMYTAIYQKRSSTEKRDDDDVPSKVDAICDAIRTALNHIDKNKYLLSILTSYVRKKSPELESALGLIKSLTGVEGVTVSAEEALKYLLFLVDVNQLYDVALGTYDFDLVLMVAAQSQKDPKEYLPFLNKLRRLEENYQKYTIDKQLKHYSKALKHISKCGDKFSECLTLVREQKLFAEAMTLFPISSQQYKDIAVAFGEYLLEKKSYEEAGIVFVKAEEFSLALEAFEKCSNWRQVMCMAALLEYTPEQEIELAMRLARSLMERMEYGGAAILLEQYAKDTEEAIVTLIEGQLWVEALRLMYRYSRTDFIETNLKPALRERHGQQMSILDSMRSDFERHRSRLALVREQKKKTTLDFIEGAGGGNYNDANADLFSDASSAAGESISSKYTTDSQRSTVISRSTGRSSRNRRKMERKKWSLKEGSPHEDLALVEALSTIITFIDRLREDVSSLMKTMVQFHYEAESADLQLKYEKFLKLIENSTSDIWLQGEGESQFTPMLGPDATANSIAQAMQQGHRVQTDSQLDPVLKVPPILNKSSRWKLQMFESVQK